MIFILLGFVCNFLSFCGQVTWDGHSGSMARTQQAAQANITLQEQIEAIHKAKGLVGEDDTKEKIGPSKPNEIHHQPPLPSSSGNMPKPSPPMQVPRPPSTVSYLKSSSSLIRFNYLSLFYNTLMCLVTDGTPSAHHSSVCCTCDSKATGVSCGAPWTRTSFNTNAAHDSCSSHQCGSNAAIRTPHHGP